MNFNTQKKLTIRKIQVTAIVILTAKITEIFCKVEDSYRNINKLLQKQVAIWHFPKNTMFITY